MNRRLLFAVGIAILGLFASSDHAFSFTGNSTWPSLQCLPSVHVTVGKIPPTDTISGPSPAWIRSNIERRLEEVGIRVLADDEWLIESQVSPQAAFLYVELSPIRHNPPTQYSFSVRMELHRTAVANYCDSSFTSWVPVWFTYAHAICTTHDYTDFSRKVLMEKLDVFLEDHRQANQIPKAPAE